MSLFLMLSSESVDWHITKGMFEIWKNGFLLIMCLIKNSYSRISLGSDTGDCSSMTDAFTRGSNEDSFTHSISSSSFLDEAKQSKLRRDRFENVFDVFRGDTTSSPSAGCKCLKDIFVQTGQRSSLNSNEPLNGWTVGCILNWPMPASPVYLNHVVLLPKSNTINSSCRSRP